jgi:hypothetical protein
MADRGEADDRANGRYRPFFASAAFGSRYITRKTLGRGTFGLTHLAVDVEDESMWAAKQQKTTGMSADDLAMLAQECDVLRALPRHRNLCWTREVFRATDFTHIVSELLTGGELFERIVQKEFYTEAEAIAVVAQVADALRAVHDAGVVHRDLKPENILYASMGVASEVKLVDFGMSAFHLPGIDDPLTQPCGTAAYAAPEVLACDGYDHKADIWSLGVIAYILLSGSPPFDSDSDEGDINALYDEVLYGVIDFSSEEWDDVSLMARSFVSTLMDRDPSTRPNADEVLGHAWLASVAVGQEGVPDSEALPLSRRPSGPASGVLDAAVPRTVGPVGAGPGGVHADAASGGSGGGLNAHAASGCSKEARNTQRSDAAVNNTDLARARANLARYYVRLRALPRVWRLFSLGLLNCRSTPLGACGVRLHCGGAWGARTVWEWHSVSTVHFAQLMRCQAKKLRGAMILVRGASAVTSELRRRRRLDHPAHQGAPVQPTNNHNLDGRDAAPSKACVVS